MRIQLSDHFGYGRMLRFVAPSVVMMIFTSIYNVVDGFFVSNFVGKVLFAAINLMTLRGMRIYGLSFLFCGFNIFGSAFFTALGDGITSAVISFLRTLVFESSSVMLVPLVFGLDGVWGSVIAAELLALGVTALSFAMKKKRYGYV